MSTLNMFLGSFNIFMVKLFFFITKEGVSLKFLLIVAGILKPVNNVAYYNMFDYIYVNPPIDI